MNRDTRRRRRQPAVVAPCIIINAAFIVSSICISSASALSSSPTTRYLNEMGRLLRHDDHHLQPSPPSLPPNEARISSPGRILPNAANHGVIFDDVGPKQHNYHRPSSFYDVYPMHNDDNTLEVTTDLGRKRFEMPQPPPQRRVDEQIVVDEIVLPDKRMSEQPRKKDLFGAFNEHIEALGRKVQETFKIVDPTSKTVSQSVSEWSYKDEDDENDDENGKKEDDFSFDYDRQHSVEGASPELLSRLNEAVAAGHDPILMASEESAAEEAALNLAAAIEMENSGRQRVNAATIAYMDDTSSHKQEPEKAARERELALQMAEFYRRQIGWRNGQPPTSITKSKIIPTLPETNDPFELLGLDYRNPPENAADIRRAFLKMAKKYHPDAVAADATPEQRDRASLNFARINAAYQLLKDKQERMGDDYFATMFGGPMYEPRNGRARPASFYRGYDEDDYKSIFSGHAYSARYGPGHGRRQQQPFRSQSGGNHRNNAYSNGESRNPFSRRNRQEVADNCHVSGKEFPPFFTN
jgi:DnaJ-domain-containing protein 1